MLGYQYLSFKIHDISVLYIFYHVVGIQLKSTENTLKMCFHPITKVLHYRDTQLSKTLKQQISASMHHLSVAPTVRRQRAIYKQQLAMCSSCIALQPSYQMKSGGAFSHEIGGKRLCFAWCGYFISVYIYSFALHLLCAAAKVCSRKWVMGLDTLSGCCYFGISPLGNLLGESRYLDLVNNVLEMENKKPQPWWNPEKKMEMEKEKE